MWSVPRGPANIYSSRWCDTYPLLAFFSRAFVFVSLSFCRAGPQRKNAGYYPLFGGVDMYHHPTKRRIRYMRPHAPKRKIDLINM